VNLRLIFTAVLVMVSARAQGQIRYGYSSSPGVSYGYDGSVTFGGTHLGGGMTVGGVTVGGNTSRGTSYNNNYYEEEQRRRQNDDLDDQRRRSQRLMDDENDDQRRREQNKRLAEVTSNTDPSPSSGEALFDGVATRKELIVVVTSGTKAKRVKKYYYFDKDGVMGFGGFRTTPVKPSEALKVSWGTGGDNAQHCYAHIPSSGAAAFGGRPVDSNICKSMLPSLFQFAKSKDGASHCYEYNQDGLIVNGAMPVKDSNCDLKETPLSSAAVVIRTGEAFNSYYSASALTCAKTVGGKIVLPVIDMPADLCPALLDSAHTASYKLIDVVAPSAMAPTYKQLGLAMKISVCALVDGASQAVIAMQFDPKQCETKSK
jgi:hypothetical protein